MKPIAWYDPTNGAVSTDKDSPLFTPLGQVWPLFLEEQQITADCPNCEWHKDRAARWRDEAYKQAGHDVIELPWVGLTKEERHEISMANRPYCADIMAAHEEELKRRNT
jgi:hypothetical protein